MADQIASFLFDHATVLMPAIVVCSLAAFIQLVRRWPRGLFRRAAAAMLLLTSVAVTAIAGGLLYAERNIRSIIEHRVGELKLHPLKGNTVTRVADLRGTIVVVNFWATWCPPCRAEMFDLNRLADRYPARNVAVLTITDESPDRVALFERRVTSLRTLVATFESDQPHGALATSAYQGRPTTVILDRQGHVRDIFIGKQSYEKLRRAVDREL